MAAHVQDIYTWIWQTLNADSELVGTFGLKGVSKYSVPEGTDFPYIVYQKQTGGHDYTFVGEALNTHYIMVKAIDGGFDGGERASLMMDRVKALLNNQRPILPNGGRVLRIRANNDFDYDEQESGNLNFYHSVIVFKVVLAEQ